MTNLLPYRGVCLHCLTKGGYQLRRDKRGRPYYRCINCQGIYFLATAKQIACFAILQNALESVDTNAMSAQANLAIEARCLADYGGRAPAEVDAKEIAAKEFAAQNITP